MSFNFSYSGSKNLNFGLYENVENCGDKDDCDKPENEGSGNNSKTSEDRSMETNENSIGILIQFIVQNLAEKDLAENGVL